MNLNFCIAGGRGFIGKIIRKALSSPENRVFVLSRKRGTTTAFSNNEFRIMWDGKKLDPEFTKNVDVFINLSGESISGRFTQKKKELIISSRVNSTKAIVNSILKSKKIPRYFIQASAIGIYKESQEMIYENSQYDNDFISEVVKKWENEVSLLKDLPIKLFILRFGIVLGRGGGIFKKMNSLIKRGLGAIPGRGDYHISWIYEKDLLNGLNFLIEKGKGGIYNFTSPSPVTGKEFFKSWGRAYKKPVLFYIPFFLLGLIYGKEIKSIAGKNLKVFPKALNDENFRFLYSDISKVFSELSSK